MNGMLNSKLLELLGTVDKNKLEQVSNIVRNMSKDDMSNLMNMLGVNNTPQAPQSPANQNPSNWGE